MKHSIIYKITCQVTNKIYIGFTKTTLENRWKEHIKKSKNGSKYIFHRAIRKYSPQKFKKQIIFCSKDSEWLLKEMEEYFIRKYNSHYRFGKGYNMTFGGQGPSGPMTSYTKQKISLTTKEKYKNGYINPFKGRHHTIKTKQFLSKKISKIFKNKGTFKGRHHTIKTKQFLSKIRKGRKLIKQWKIKSPNGQIFIILDLKKFCFIKKINYHSLYNSLKSKSPIKKRKL